MAGDAYYPGVSLLLPLTGANGATAFPDKSATPKTVNYIGSVTTVTGVGIGGSSAQFTGSSARLTVNDSADLRMRTGDFTIEGFVYAAKSGQTENYPRLAAKGGYLAVGGWNIVYFKSSGALVFDVYPDGTTAIPVQMGTLADSTLTHFAACRQGGVLRTFLGGVKISEVSNTTDLNDVNNMLSLGAEPGGASTFIGNMSQFRVTKGYARYTASFTPPSVPFLDYAGQISGNVKDDAGANASRTVRAYRRDTGDLVGSVSSDASTGNFSFNCKSLGPHTVVFLDDDAGTQYNALVIDRVVPA